MELSRFCDRAKAGRLLGERLRHYVGRDDVIVLALPPGGVPVANEVASQLGAPLDVFVVRKLDVPGYEELAMGAVASGGLLVLDPRVVRGFGIDPSQVGRAIGEQLREVERGEAAYRRGREPPQLEGKTVILVDEGLETGSTMRAAALAVRKANPARVAVAVAVAAPETCAQFEDVVDEVVCGWTPSPFQGVGTWYEDFTQTTDEEATYGQRSRAQARGRAGA
jgi:putative phosphoribosyl transferase